MSVIYLAEVEGEELDITRADLEALDVESIAPDTYHVLRKMKGHQIKVIAADHQTKEYRLLIGDKEVEVKLKDEVEIQVHAMGLDEISAAHTRDIIAPMPGLVLEISVKAGDNVEEGDQLIILEAMKMENVLSSPGQGIIEAVHVTKGQPVDKAQLLITFE